MLLELGIGQIAFFIGFSISMTLYHAKNRRFMMGRKACSDAFYCIYFFSVGAFAGGYVTVIAGIGALIQAFTLEKYMRQTMIARSVLATVLAVLGLYICMQNTYDIYPLVAMVIARFAELQNSQQRIRLGFLLPQMLFFAYAVEAGITLLFFSIIAQMSSNLYAIWCEEQKRKRMALAPIRV